MSDAALPSTPDGATSPEVAPSRRPRRRWPLLVLVGLVVLLLLRGLVLETFTVPSESMEPTLRGGDRIAVWKPGADDVRRGDIVVFDGTRVFGSGAQEPPASGLRGTLRDLGSAVGIRPGQQDYVKRVIGVGGDRVSMDATGQVRRNGRALAEPYAQRQGSGEPFSVIVPAGRLWVMGDHRAASDDSRNYLGVPGGGTVPVDAVIGQVSGRYWPLDRAGDVATRTTTTHQGEQ